MHAAIIAAEVRRTINPRRKVDLQGFMLMDPRKRAQGTVAAFIETLKASAAGGRKHVSEAIKRPVRSKAVKRGGPGTAHSSTRGTVKPAAKRTRQGE